MLFINNFRPLQAKNVTFFRNISRHLYFLLETLC
jgi:hypothetical protein